ncbi:MAG: gliding motility lipoprotein GldH [Chitinophagaceae bacterium]|nr:gliding motility lipoprotein GldH [Chitinophagaceae bacterium]
MNRKDHSILRRVPYALFLMYCILSLASCTTIDLYEKSVSIPGHAWKNSFRPSFSFTIKDTASAYELFLVIRHTDKYSFNNIYVNIYAQTPGMDTAQAIRRDLTLATDEKGWLGKGMDDIYEHRISLTDAAQPLHFRKSGNYTFTVEQIMREDPLKNVLNVGLRIEKKK